MVPDARGALLLSLLVHIPTLHALHYRQRGSHHIRLYYIQRHGLLHVPVSASEYANWSSGIHLRSRVRVYRPQCAKFTAPCCQRSLRACDHWELLGVCLFILAVLYILC